MVKLTILSYFHDRSHTFETTASKSAAGPGAHIKRPRLWVLVCVILVSIITAVLIELHIRGIEHPALPHFQTLLK